MVESTIAAGIARALMDLAVSKGASRSALAHRSGIDPAGLRDCDGRVPLAQYAALMRAGQELCGDPALALHFGEEVDASELSFLGAFSSVSETMAGDVAEMNHYSPLDVEIEGGGDRFQLDRTEGRPWLVDSRPNPNDFPELTESFFARVVCSLRRRFGDARRVEAVRMTHPEPAYRAEYDRIFRAPVAFESDRNALLFSEDLWAAARLAFSSRRAAGVLRDHAETLLARLSSSRTTRGRVEELLRPLLHTGGPGIDAVAAELGLSRQTLFRRLRTEGVTFEQVRDGLRREEALRLLREGRTSVKETASRLGYSDTSAFSRAFKRWTTRSPRAMWSSRDGR